MTAKEFLMSYGEAKEKLRMNRERILRAEELSRELDRRSAAGAISEWQDRLYEENEELCKLMFGVERAVYLSPCTPTEKEVLTRRYIRREKWEDISEAMTYTTQSLHRIERSARAKLRLPKERESRQAQ